MYVKLCSKGEQKANSDLEAGKNMLSPIKITNKEEEDGACHSV